MQIKVGSSQ